jgi:hypothetical protein
MATSHQGRGALFTGQSGAGKSTLFTLCQKAGLQTLSDELVAVTPDGAGLLLHGTPWNTGKPATARSALLGILTQARAAALEPLSGAELLRTLISNVVVPDQSAEGRRRVFEVASTVVNALHTVRLSFAIDVSVARVLRDALERSGLS